MAAAPKALTETAFDKALASGATLMRHPYARVAWVKGRNEATLYVSGQAYECPAALAERLSGERELSFDRTPSGPEKAVLLALLNDGQLAVRKARRR